MIKEWIRKGKKQICCVGAGFMLFGLAVYGEKNDSVSRGILERDGYGGDSKTYELLVEGISDEPLPLSIELGPLQYEQEEARNIFDQLFCRLPSLILGENESLTQVTTDLNLVTLFDDTGVRALWQSRNPEILDSYGHVTSEEIDREGEPVTLLVVLTDGIYRKEGELELVVYPPFQSGEDMAAADFRKEIYRLDAEHRTERHMVLPGEYKGRPIRYQNGASSEYWLLPVLGIVLAVLFCGQEKAEEGRRQKKRSQLLLLDYGDVVYQLMVYTGAGLTVGKSWERMVENYERGKKKGSRRLRPAYEEMAVALNDMRCGIPEGKAINEFGRRCKLQPYMKLSSLLEQNRKTGTKNLHELLEQEMTQAWEEQKHTAKRLGEEAGTELLVPLFLMLLVVMVIVMVPALMAVS